MRNFIIKYQGHLSSEIYGYAITTNDTLKIKARNSVTAKNKFFKKIKYKTDILGWDFYILSIFEEV